MTNFGFYVYAFITVGNAARAAAQHTADVSRVGLKSAACEAALLEMKSLPNLTGVTNCNNPPLQVTAVKYTDEFGDLASKVTVSYQTIRMFRLPFMVGQMTVSRTTVMRVI